MAKRRVETSLEPPDLCFAKELLGEALPSFSTLRTLYELASELCEIRPWGILDESELILVRAGAGSEMCYCSVMGAAGEVYSMHAYIGDEGLRLFQLILAGKIEPGEFIARQHAVSVEFVPRNELERQDRELLGWLGHPKGKGIACPIFRALRPGYFPWFVSAEETQILAECMRAVIAVCSVVLNDERVNFWDRAETYPLVSMTHGETEDKAPQYKIDLIKPSVPDGADCRPVQLDEVWLGLLRKRDYPIRGATELDHFASLARVGKVHERKTCACIALAVDAASGMVNAPETTDATVPVAEALANVFLKSVQSTRCIPKEVHVRTNALKDALVPLTDSLGVAVRVSRKLRAADQARESLLQFMGGGI